MVTGDFLSSASAVVTGATPSEVTMQRYFWPNLASVIGKDSVADCALAHVEFFQPLPALYCH